MNFGDEKFQVGGIAAVIFDCDGTLVDTEPLENRVFASMLTDWGYPITAQQSQDRFRGAKKDDALKDIEKETGRTMARADFIGQWRERSEALFSQELVVIPGARELLGSLTLPFCIASNGPVSKMQVSLRITGLAEFFDDRLFSAYDLGVWKPEPDLFLFAASQMNVEPSACLVIEDSMPGVMAAHAARMPVMALQPEADAPSLSDQAIRIQSLSQVGQYLKENAA